MRKSIKRIITLLFAIILFGNANAQLKNYSWRTLTTNSDYTPREEGDFVETGGKFYLIGGRGIKNVYVFDPATNAWTAAAKPPMELHHFQAAVYKGEIYLCAAMTGAYPHEKPVDNIYIYNPQTDTWRTGAIIPVERRRGCAGVAVYKNKFYIVSGILDGHYTGNVPWFDVYDPETNQWTVLKDALTTRDHFKIAIVDNKLYCIGGVQSNAKEKKGLLNTLTNIDVYDLKKSAWTTTSTCLPTPRAGSGLVVIKNEILIVGGESAAQKASHTNIEAFNVKTNTFTEWPKLITGTHAGGAIYYKKKIYVAGGVANSGGTPLVTTTQVYSD